jgi:hypothetical protein
VRIYKTKKHIETEKKIRGRFIYSKAVEKVKAIMLLKNFIIKN